MRYLTHFPITIFFVIINAFGVISELILISSEFSSQTFSNNEIGTWQILPFSSNIISDCNNFHILGGFNQFGKGLSMEKSVNNMLPHYSLRIQMNFLKIDFWFENESFQIYINNILSYSFFPNKKAPFLISDQNECGQSENDSYFSLDLNITSKEEFFTLKFTTNLTTNTGFWGIRDLKFSIDKCHISCKTCSSFTSYSCLSCPSLSTLSNGICKCSSGFYESIPIFPCFQSPCLYCVNCFSTCKTCENGGSNEDCITCQPGTLLRPGGICVDVCIPPYQTDLIEKKCISPCSTDQYVDTVERICKSCNSECETCYGPTINNCLSCPESKNTFLDYKTCVIKCPESKYADIATRKCILNCASINALEDPLTKQCIPFKCSTNCLTCKYPLNDFCLSCANGQKLSSASVCVNIECDVNCLICKEEIINDCIRCKEKFYLYNGKCMMCNEKCLNCKGSLENDCLSCVEPLKYYNNRCYDEYLCDSSCKTCNGFTKEECLSCFDSYVLENNKCLNCYSNCKSCFGVLSNNCLSCFPNKILYESKCFDEYLCHSSCKQCDGFKENNCLSCFDSYYLQDKQCFPCNNLCKTCFGPFFNNCSSCILSKIYYNNQCFDDYICHETCKTCNGFTINNCLTCYENRYLEGNRCNACFSTCETCFGPLVSNCKTCLESKKFFENKCYDDYICHSSCKSCNGFTSNDCISCLDSYYFQDNKCIKCHSSCLSCFGSLEDNCLSCSNTKIFYQNKCYLNYICHSTCKTCNGFTENDCLTCFPSFYLNNKKCLPCYSFCQECYGPSINNCLKCFSPLIFYNNTCFKDYICDSSCVKCNGFTKYDCTSCLSNKYLEKGECLNCDESCKTCNGLSPFNCSSCYSPKILENNYCKLPCYYKCLTCSGITEFDCLTCIQGLFLVNNQCVRCHSSCYTCYGPLETNCLSCDISSYLANSTCFRYICHKTCELCKGTTISDCLSCIGSRVLNEGLCLYKNNCTANTYYNFTSNSCLSNCSPDSSWKYPSARNCIDDCPKRGYYSDLGAKSCYKCAENCDICLDWKLCSKCLSHHYLNEGNCVLGCPTGKYLDQNLKCQKCISICSECYGPEEKYCRSCIYPYFYDGFEYKCTKDCSGSNYGKKETGVCEICDFECSKCFGPNNNQCLSCSDKNKYFSQFSCVNQCVSYSYTNNTNMSCEFCIVDNCETCADKNPYFCDICKDGYYLKENNYSFCFKINKIFTKIDEVYRPSLYKILFDQEWPLFFWYLNYRPQALIKITIYENNTKRFLNENEEKISQDFKIKKNDFMNEFYLHINISQNLKSDSFVSIEFNDIGFETGYMLSNNKFIMNLSIFELCEEDFYFDNDLIECLPRIVLTPNVKLNFDSPLSLYLEYSDSIKLAVPFEIYQNLSSLLFLIFDVKKTDNYTFSIKSNPNYPYTTNKPGFIEFQYYNTIIGRPKLTIFLNLKQIPIYILLHPKYNSNENKTCNLLPFYVLSEETIKSINSSSDSVSIADIASNAIIIANTILNSGSSFFVRGLMLSEYIFSSGFLNIAYPPNIVYVLKSKSSTKLFDLNKFFIDDLDLLNFPEIFQIYKLDPYFYNNIGEIFVQILIVIAISFIFKLSTYSTFILKLLNENSKTGNTFRSLLYIFDWNFTIIFLSSKFTRLVFFSMLNLRFYSFQTTNGIINFFLALLVFLFTIIFPLHLFIISYNIYNYKAPEPKIIEEQPKEIIINDKNTDFFKLETKNVLESMKILNNIQRNTKRNKVGIAIPELSNENTPKKLETPSKKKTILEDMLPSGKINRNKTINNEVNLSESQLFEIEKQNFMQSKKTTYSNNQMNSEKDEFLNLPNTNQKVLHRMTSLEANTIKNKNLPVVNIEDFMKNNDASNHSNIWDVGMIKNSLNPKRAKKRFVIFKNIYSKLYDIYNLEQYLLQYKILYFDIKNIWIFQKYFVSIDLLRHFIVNILIVLLYDTHIEGISIILSINLLYLIFLFIFRPLKDSFLMNSILINEILINNALFSALLLAILDVYEETSFIDERIYIGWNFVFSFIVLLYFLMLVAILRTLRNIKIFKLIKNKTKVHNFSENIALENNTRRPSSSIETKKEQIFSQSSSSNLNMELINSSENKKKTSEDFKAIDIKNEIILKDLDKEIDEQISLNKMKENKLDIYSIKTNLDLGRPENTRFFKRNKK